MPSNDPTFHRAARLRAIQTWSLKGLGAERASFPVEQQFRDRVARCDGAFFTPLDFPSPTDDVRFHREVSFLVDAFDQFPGRVDLSYDAAWKAFESGVTELYEQGNITQALNLCIATLMEPPISRL